MSKVSDTASILATIVRVSAHFRTANIFSHFAGSESEKGCNEVVGAFRIGT